jgi:hypothetical protein
MNPPPTVGLKTLIIFGLSFVKQLAHGLVKRFAGYVTLLNAFVLVTQFLINMEDILTKSFNEFERSFQIRLS